MNFLIGVACVAAVVVAFCAVAIVNRLDQLIGIITGARERTKDEDQDEDEDEDPGKE
jgi:hypothetical protein